MLSSATYVEILTVGDSTRYADLGKVLNGKEEYPSTKDWLNAVLASIPDEKSLEPDTLERLKYKLRVNYGAEYLVIGDDFKEHIEFWSALRDQFPDAPELTVILADTYALAGDSAKAADLFLEGLKKAPTLLYEYGGDLPELMSEAGTDYEFQYDLLCVIAAFEDSGDDDGELAELKEKYSGDAGYLTEIEAATRRYL